MSLRTDIRRAFEEVEPATGGLPERVVQTVVNNRERRRRHGWLVRVRAPLSLVAALVVIALVVGAVVGGRLWQDWNALSKPSSPANTVLQTQVAQLEKRPIRLPHLAAGVECPDGPEANGIYGDGPVYGASGWPEPQTAEEIRGDVTTSWGFYGYLTDLTAFGLTGAVLERGRDLRTDQPMVFVGPYAAGAAAGADTVDGKAVQRHLELVLDTSHPPSYSSHGARVEWPVIVGLAKGASDCVGFQFDGPAFTETFVAYVQGRP